MPLTFMSSKKYKNYTQSDMTNALINIKTTGMSVMTASKTFKIPQRTLYDRIKKKYTLRAGPLPATLRAEGGPKPVRRHRSVGPKQQTEELKEDGEKYTNIESFLEPEIIIEEKPYHYLIKTESISEEKLETIINPTIEEKLKITHEIDILEQQIEDDQIKNKSELLRKLFLLKFASK